MKKVVFLDRDGVINERTAPHQYITKPQDFILKKDVCKAISLLNSNNYLVLVVSNQRGIATGEMTLLDLEKIHNKLNKELLKNKAQIDKIYFCPHNIGECDCRKPKIGMFLNAEKDFNIDKEGSWMIGDSESDILAGKNYGVQTIYIGETCKEANFVCNSLLDATKIIIGREKSK